MLLLAVVGAVVLAMVSWAALREAQRLPRSFPVERRAKAGAVSDAAPAPATEVEGRRLLPAPPPVVVGDPTMADADIDEALAAAAALWHVLLDDDPR